MFYDRSQEITQLLMDLHDSLELLPSRRARAHKVRADFSADGLLSTAGYTGFRWATQIDALWNAYLLALVIELGPDIEARRIPISRNTVFSYRFQYDDSTASLFSSSHGWRAFQETSIARASEFGCQYVLSCDIADFYPRIYHHTLENELQRCTTRHLLTEQIMMVLAAWSNNASYGLPVGGDAARLLAELALNPIDRLLLYDNIQFCRFVDDIRIFARSKEAAHAAWVSLSEKLLKTEGLQLQKHKTVLEPSHEFVRRAKASLGLHVDDESTLTTEARQEAAFLAIRIHYDPYSPTATDDYEQLREEIERHDILGMLNRQLARSRIDQPLFRKLLQSARFLSPGNLHLLCVSLLDSIDAIYPVFPLAMRLLRDSMPKFSPEQQNDIVVRIRDLCAGTSYVVRVPINKLYALRLLVYDPSIEADQLLAHEYATSASPSVRRDIILIMASRRVTPWLKGVKLSFQTLSKWERRAFIVASYVMGDEGKHWRKAFASASTLDGIDKALSEWMASKMTLSGWELPL